MCVLCTQIDNGKQFIGKIQKIENGVVYFDYTLRDDGTNSGYCKGDVNRFTFEDYSGFCEIADFVNDLVKDDITPSEPEPEQKPETSSSDGFQKVPFNFEKYKSAPCALVTRDGRNARFVASNVKGKYPILMLIEQSDGIELPTCYNENGYAGIPGKNATFNSIMFDGLDLFMLMETPKPTIKYARIYQRDSTGTTFTSQLVNDPKEFDSIEVPTGCSIIKIIPIEL
jgi:hypothetical protein